MELPIRPSAPLNLMLSTMFQHNGAVKLAYFGTIFFGRDRHCGFLERCNLMSLGLYFFCSPNVVQLSLNMYFKSVKIYSLYQPLDVLQNTRNRTSAPASNMIWKSKLYFCIWICIVVFFLSFFSRCHVSFQNSVAWKLKESSWDFVFMETKHLPFKILFTIF